MVHGGGNRRPLPVHANARIPEERTMKLRLSLLAASLSLVALAGCGGSTSSSEFNSEPATPDATVALSTSNIDLASRAAANAALGSASVSDVNPASRTAA